ncbi:TraR/DksA C4-type zinc finger protein [Streptomyces sp. G-G2]|uniref:TraR/DksA family transcriptional regulator n=1 Tax=Streptomyces sp. G-G2 TaxID=3046201 RepID=UPI0032D99681
MVAKKTAAKKTASVNEASAEPVKKVAKKTVKKAAKAAVKAAVKTPANSRPANSTPAHGAAAGSAAGKSGPTGSKRTAKTTAKTAPAAPAREETGAGKVVAKKSTGTARKTATAATSGLPKTRASAAKGTGGSGGLAVRPGEDPWTPGEEAEARTELTSEVLRLRGELAASEQAISGLMRDSGDGAGDDQADTGTKNITRESELALAANAHDMLEQTERALERLEAGTYGLCENCGKAIGKARMQAFPRATLCVECKQKQERRH